MPQLLGADAVTSRQSLVVTLLYFIAQLRPGFQFEHHSQEALIHLAKLGFFQSMKLMLNNLVGMLIELDLEHHFRQEHEHKVRVFELNISSSVQNT